MGKTVASPPHFDEPNHMLKVESPAMNAGSSLVSCTCESCSSAKMTQRTVMSVVRKRESFGAVQLNDGWLTGGKTTMKLW